MRGVYNLLRMCMHHAWETRFPEPDSIRLLHQQHTAVLDAVIAGDPERAQEAAHLHLSFVRESLQQLEAQMRKGRAGSEAKHAVKRRAGPRRRAR